MNTSLTPPDPKTTLAVILGASEFPKIPSLEANIAFKNSAEALKRYLLNTKKFGIPEANVLDLFNSLASLSDIDNEIAEFLSNRSSELKTSNRNVSDIILYYVGHGEFTNDNMYYLTLYNTKKDQPITSGYLTQALATTLRHYATHIRKYIILDSCFSAACYQNFQGAPLQMAAQQIVSEFDYPNKGTALLCAANKDDTAKILPGYEYTMFSTALLDILDSGSEYCGPYLSFQDIGNLTEQRIKDIFKDEAVRPEIHSPDQSQGNIATMPFFPNFSKNISQTDVPYRSVPSSSTEHQNDDLGDRMHSKTDSKKVTYDFPSPKKVREVLLTQYPTSGRISVLCTQLKEEGILDVDVYGNIIDRDHSVEVNNLINYLKVRDAYDKFIYWILKEYPGLFK